jgi:tRNA (cmo5U34)-methyltransferase
VLGDIVAPDDPSDVVTPIDRDYDRPSTVVDQLGWLAAAGLQPLVAWAHCDLAVLVGQAPPDQ